MTSVQGCGRPRWEHLSAAPSIAPPDSFPASKLSDELSDQSARPSRTKSLAYAPTAATSVPKYSKDDLQRIFKAVLEARACAPTPAPVVISKMPWEKLKAYSPNVYYVKSHIDCYNFCQQCKNYFATARATRPNRIFFAAFFHQDRISFRWQQYKQKQDGNSSVPVTCDEFKAFFFSNLANSQAFVKTYWGKIKRDS